MKEKHLNIGEGEYKDLRYVNNNEDTEQGEIKRVTTLSHSKRQNTLPLYFFFYREYTNFPNLLQLRLKTKWGKQKKTPWNQPGGNISRSG